MAIFYGTPESDVGRANCLGCQSVHQFGFRNRRVIHGNDPGTIRIPYCVFSILCVPYYRAPRKCL